MCSAIWHRAISCVQNQPASDEAHNDALSTATLVEAIVSSFKSRGAPVLSSATNRIHAIRASLSDMSVSGAGQNESGCGASLAILLLFCMQSSDNSNAFFCSHILIANVLTGFLIGYPGQQNISAELSARIERFEVCHLMILAVYTRVWGHASWFITWLFSAARLVEHMYPVTRDRESNTLPKSPKSPFESSCNTVSDETVPLVSDRPRPPHSPPLARQMSGRPDYDLAKDLRHDSAHSLPFTSMRSCDLSKLDSAGDFGGLSPQSPFGPSCNTASSDETARAPPLARQMSGRPNYDLAKDLRHDSAHSLPFTSMRSCDLSKLDSAGDFGGLSPEPSAPPCSLTVSNVPEQTPPRRRIERLRSFRRRNAHQGKQLLSFNRGVLHCCCHS